MTGRNKWRSNLKLIYKLGQLFFEIPQEQNVQKYLPRNRMIRIIYQGNQGEIVKSLITRSRSSLAKLSPAAAWKGLCSPTSSTGLCARPFMPQGPKYFFIFLIEIGSGIYILAINPLPAWCGEQKKGKTRGKREEKRGILVKKVKKKKKREKNGRAKV